MRRLNASWRVLAFAAVGALLLLLHPAQRLAADSPPQRVPDFTHRPDPATLARLYLPGRADSAPGTPEAGVDEPPAWSRLSYFSYANDNWDIYYVYPDGSHLTRVTSLPSMEAYPSLSRGCARVVYASDRYGKWDLYAANVDGSGETRLSEGTDDTFPAWSPDGSRIAFTSERSQDPEVYVMQADGSNVVRLTHVPGYDGQPAWSPDGSQIAYASEAGGGVDIWIMNADGSNAHRLTYTTGASNPSWSPAGDRIAYVTDSTGDGWLEVWYIGVDGLNPTGVASGGRPYDYSGPSWSPDGEWLAMTLTTWEYHDPYWYWTTSKLIELRLATGERRQPFSDTRIWYPNWSTTDATPPGPCDLVLPSQQRQPSFVVSWSAEDPGGSGVRNYDVQLKASPSAPWQDVKAGTATTAAVIHDLADGTAQLRCRARDWAYNVAGWDAAPVYSTSVDSVRPRSQVAPLPAEVRGPSVTVGWSGSDEGGSVSSYSVLVRDGIAADWQVWQDDVPGTSAEFTGEPLHTYYFRSRARDAFGHVEGWEPQPQARVTLYTRALAGSVTDARGNAGLEAEVWLDGALATYSDPISGDYRVLLGDELTHTLQISATGYAQLSPAAVPAQDDVHLDWVLPPGLQIVGNGTFDKGTLDGWEVEGDGAQVAAPAAHTGPYGLQLAHGAPATTSVVQTISVPSELHRPTLSFVYRIPSDLAGGTLTVRLEGQTSETVLQTSAATTGWVPVWADLAPYLGQSVDLRLELNAVGTAWVDELWVGPWETPLVQAVSPSEWPADEGATLSLAGRNLLDAPRVFLGELELSAVSWVSETLVTAVAPPGLQGGRYDLRIANPGGAATTLRNAVRVRSPGVVLPLVSRNYAFGAANGEADWPFLGRDVGHTGSDPDGSGASRYAFAWSAPVTSLRSLRSAAVSDGIVLVAADLRPNYWGDDWGVSALDSETGRALWMSTRTDMDGVYSPAVAYGVVYFQEVTGQATGSLVGLDLRTGQSRNVAYYSAQWYSYLAPTVADDGVYVTCGNPGGMCGFDAADGHLLWRLSWDMWDDWTPAYADGLAFAWTGGGWQLDEFSAVDAATGEMVWSLHVPYCGDPYSMHTAPVVWGSTALVASACEIDAIDLNARSIRWHHAGNYQYTIPALAGDVVYALLDGDLEARRLSDGELLWSFTGDGSLTHQPVVAGHYVYVASGAAVYVVDTTTHQSVWQTTPGGWLQVAGGFLYVAGSDGTLRAYRAQEP